MKDRISGTTAVSEPDMAQKLINLHKAKPDFREDWMRNMILTNFGAGMETLGVTMSSLIVKAIIHEAVQLRIQQEIDLARKEGRLGYPPRLGEMQRELPYLTACLEESMRLHGVIGTPLPRVVPDGGVSIDGYYIPAGVCSLFFLKIDAS